MSKNKNSAHLGYHTRGPLWMSAFTKHYYGRHSFGGPVTKTEQLTTKAVHINARVIVKSLSDTES